MRWGIRRYQNRDGSLTPEGKARLRIDKYENDHDSDTVVKKGTKVSRVISTSGVDEYRDDDFKIGKEAKKYIKDTIAKDIQYERKYVSIDDVKNSGRANGKEFYLSWFTDHGWVPDFAQVTMYELKKDVRIASGKKVIDALLEEVGSKKVESLLRKNGNAYELTMEYTKNKELFNKVNKRFIDEGYDGVEDVNDPDTDMPVILFNSSKSLGSPISIQTGKEAIDEYFKKHGQ